MSLYPVLQSGFVAASEKGLQRTNPSSPSLRDVMLYHSARQPLAKYFYSPEITDLYMQYCAQPGAMRKFEFREHLLRVALKSFSGLLFPDWMRLQNHKPTVSELHKTFLIETVGYVLRDVPRSIHCAQWLRLLEASEKASSVDMDVEKHFRVSVRNPVLAQTPPHPDQCGHPTDVATVVRTWVSKPGGFEDLLLSLFAIFGSRSQRTEVTMDL